MLTDHSLEQILNRQPELTIGVLGDLFLDRYLDIDAALTEPSLETGLDAHQVVRVRSYPGAAGTVVKNLNALGVGRVIPISVIGDDGEGFELRQSLSRFCAVEQKAVFVDKTRRTPTYAKPMWQVQGESPRELNRLDFKNWAPLHAKLEDCVLNALDQFWPSVDALIVLDQVNEVNCGVVTERVLQRLSELGSVTPDKLILADSRRRIGNFRDVCLKPNRAECMKAAGVAKLQDAIQRLAYQCGRPVFCTSGEDGVLLGRPGEKEVLQVAGFRVNGPIDPVGAGDSVSAAIACGVAAGASLEASAAFGNLVASITIQQIGITGVATQDEVRQRWSEISIS